MQRDVGAYVRAKAVQWQPGADTVWALVSIPLMWGCYYANTQLSAGNPVLALVIFFLIGNILVCTLLPALVVRRVAGEGAWGLGFTRHRLWTALAIMLIAGLGSLPYYLQLAGQTGVDPIEHLAYNLVVFWEPLFVYGWLQLRFTRAFGWLPAIVLSSLGFVAYHVGSVPLPGLITFFITGIVFGIIMAITRNLWSIVPLTAAVSSGIGTLQSGLSFDWSTAASGAVVLLVQIVILVLIFRRPAPVSTPEAPAVR